MPTPPELHQRIREKYATGELPIREMLDLASEMRTQNMYATRLGLKNSPGMEGHVPSPKENNVNVFFTERDVIFVGEDAVRAAALIKSAYEHILSLPKEALTGTQLVIMKRFEKGRVKLEKRKVDGLADDVAYLSLWREHWNDWAVALYAAGGGLDGFQIE